MFFGTTDLCLDTNCFIMRKTGPICLLLMGLMVSQQAVRPAVAGKQKDDNCVIKIRQHNF